MIANLLKISYLAHIKPVFIGLFKLLKI